MIYWDHNSTTPCAPEVVEAMQRYWNEEYGNPSSAHLMGRRAAAAVRTAREQVAALANALPAEMIFTSGATESNNLLFLGVLLTPRSGRKRIAVSAIEHKSVLEPAHMLEEHGFELVILPVNNDGITDIESARRMINEETLLVSVQAVNNELGTIQPVAELAEIAHNNGAYFHTDAAQALGKIPFDVQQVNCDFASFSAHKMYGPKGIGTLYVRGGARRWPWGTPFRGGGQEAGLRPGTSNVPAIVGFGKACELCGTSLTKNNQHLHLLTGQFAEMLLKRFPRAVILNRQPNSVPGTLSVLFEGIPSDLLLARCKSINLSKGSACNGIMEASHVIKAIVAEPNRQEAVVRISFGRNSGSEGFEQFFEILNTIEQEL
jgi:cysteine desulfurase